MKVTAPISGKKKELRTEEWAIDNGYLTEATDHDQAQSNDMIIDYNEYSYEMLIDGIEYYIKRRPVNQNA